MNIHPTALNEQLPAATKQNEAFVLTVSCTSSRGIVAAISGYLAEAGCNITDSSQFDDTENGTFFMRVAFRSELGKSQTDLAEGFAPVAEALGMTYQLHNVRDRMKVILMVSKLGHCLIDLLYRWRIGALPIDIVAVVSNHMDHQKVVVNHDLPFYCIKVTKETKPEAEAKLWDLIQETEAELVVLARYMQILSDDMCRKMAGRIINIHHSFLPSFIGAKPYHQAYARGVKLIGATSHYVTSELDEGPIIEQDIVRVTHAQTANDFASLGRDVESTVLARAIHAHIKHRAFISGNKVVVFPAGRGDYESRKV
ncbi:MAG: formyltetrahydrofolate deformylase [Rhodospirillaceae bacterium]